jgi:hypothetical protein
MLLAAFSWSRKWLMNNELLHISPLSIWDSFSLVGALKFPASNFFGSSSICEAYFHDRLAGRSLPASSSSTGQAAVTNNGDSNVVYNSSKISYTKHGYISIRRWKETGSWNLNNEFDAVVALVLLLCPRVTSLTLGLDMLLQNSFLPIVME